MCLLKWSRAATCSSLSSSQVLYRFITNSTRKYAQAVLDGLENAATVASARTCENLRGIGLGGMKVRAPHSLAFFTARLRPRSTAPVNPCLATPSISSHSDHPLLLHVYGGGDSDAVLLHVVFRFAEALDVEGPTHSLVPILSASASTEDKARWLRRLTFLERRFRLQR